MQRFSNVRFLTASRFENPLPYARNFVGNGVAQIGYARVSTEEQTLQSQMDALRAAGCVRIFEEHASGGDPERLVLGQALRAVGRGDTLVVVRLDRLARSLSHLLRLLEGLEARGAHFRSLSDPIDTASPQGKFTLQVLGAAAEFERALILSLIHI